MVLMSTGAATGRVSTMSVKYATRRHFSQIAVIVFATSSFFEASPQSAVSNPQLNTFSTSIAKDPGVRGGPSGAGLPITGLTAGELDFFRRSAQPIFAEVDGVKNGLGPRFNLNSCAGCHAYPAIGGSSPLANPQVTHASSMAPGNSVPAFLSARGPIREVRFINNSDGTPDGGVHDIFTISGRPDSPPNCAIEQPDFSDTSNVIFRIPTPVFGDGLIESIPDEVIRANLASDPVGQKASNGVRGQVNVGFVGGTVNTNPNDGGLTRFGWKAQNKSMTVFAGEAYNVEMGVTNEVFPNEREDDPDCAKNPTPESDSTFAIGSVGPSDVAAFRSFMRFLAPPLPSCSGTSCSSSVQNGHSLASQIGCLTCHTETLTTGASTTAALSHQPVHLFSDLAVHHMGTGLADGITQGSAGPDEFRSAPLWGLGQRIFFLHDGRTADLMQAIKAHQSQGSEANGVVTNFEKLTPAQQQDVLNFLRTL
jgi:CxxC motif-containing protein (DUF1111 family)